MIINKYNININFILMKNEKIDMGRESDTFHVSQDGVYTITGTNSRHGITVSAGVRATIFLQDVNLCDLGDMGVAFHIAETAISR